MATSTSPPQPAPAPIALVERIVTAILAIDGVVRLHGGAVGEFATFGGGHKIPGVRVGRRPGDPVEVRLVAAYGWPLPELARQVRSATRVVLEQHDRAAPVTVRIVDLATSRPEATGPAATGHTGARTGG